MKITELDKMKAAALKLKDRLLSPVSCAVNFDGLPPTRFIDSDGFLCVSTEDGRNFGDYFGENNNGYPWIRDCLCMWATQNNGHFEWKNPGTMVFIPR